MPPVPFPQELYKLDYPASGAPELADEVIGLLRGQGIEMQADARRRSTTAPGCR